MKPRLSPSGRAVCFANRIASRVMCRTLTRPVKMHIFPVADKGKSGRRFEMGRANRLWRYAAVLGVVWVLAGGVPSAVAGPNYRFDPTLSLTGDCTTSPVDAVPDPSCPYGAPPSGPIGPFAGPRAVAVDESGNVYVASYAEGSSSKGRVDIFDDEGKFIAEAAIPKVRSMAVDGQGNLYVFEVTSGT